MSFNFSRELRSAVSVETRKGLGRRIPSRAIFMLGRASGNREEIRLLEHAVRYAFLLDWYYHHSWRDDRILGSILLGTRRTNRAWSAQHCLFHTCRSYFLALRLENRLG